MSYLRTINKNTIAESKEKLVDFLWNFHNNVNRLTKAKYFSKEELDKYKTANTGAIVSHFIKVMSATSNNEKTMLHGFHRTLFLKKFREYIQANHQKFNG